MILLVQNV